MHWVYFCDLEAKSVFYTDCEKKQVKAMITFNAAHFMPVYFYSNNSQQQLLQGALKRGPHTPQC